MRTDLAIALYKKDIQQKHLMEFCDAHDDHIDRSRMCKIINDKIKPSKRELEILKKALFFAGLEMSFIEKIVQRWIKKYGQI